MYLGCQCSRARWSRLLLARPTLFGIFSAEIMWVPRYQFPVSSFQSPGSRSVFFRLVTGNRKLRPSEIKLRPRLRSESRQCALFSDGVGPLENPVLPRCQASEYLGFHCLRPGEA